MKLQQELVNRESRLDTCVRMELGRCISLLIQLAFVVRGSKLVRNVFQNFLGMVPQLKDIHRAMGRLDFTGRVFPSLKDRLHIAQDEFCQPHSHLSDGCLR
jgi:hypothetical protein